MLFAEKNKLRPEATRYLYSNPSKSGPRGRYGRTDTGVLHQILSRTYLDPSRTPEINKQTYTNK